VSSDERWRALLRRQDGVVTRRHALRFISARVLGRHLAEGRWQTVHRGVYVTHNGPVSASQRLWAAVLAASAGGPALLGGPTALTLHGLQRFDSQVVHVVVPHKRRACSLAGVEVHRVVRMSSVDIARTSPPSTTPPRSMVDAASWARSDREARTIVAMCFQQRLVTGAEVDAVIARMPAVTRRKLIARAAADARAGAHSLGELDLVALCRRARLPTPSLQRRRGGRYLDALFEEWGVWVEVDGAHHMSADEWWNDMKRHNELVRRGEVLLRFPAWMVRDEPAAVANTIRKALRAAGWR
jgi:very-short-patch-repair endonuclease